MKVKVLVQESVLPTIKLAWSPVKEKNKSNTFDISDKKLSVTMACPNWKLKYKTGRGEHYLSFDKTSQICKGFLKRR